MYIYISKYINPFKGTPSSVNEQSFWLIGRMRTATQTWLLICFFCFAYNVRRLVYIITFAYSNLLLFLLTELNIPLSLPRCDLHCVHVVAESIPHTDQATTVWLRRCTCNSEPFSTLYFFLTSPKASSPHIFLNPSGIWV